MGVQADKPVHLEEQRRQLVEEIAAEHGPDWADQYKPGSFGCHELLDRTILAAELVERSVLSHPACAQNSDWYVLAEQAVAALNDLYQRIGAEHMSD